MLRRTLSLSLAIAAVAAADRRLGRTIRGFRSRRHAGSRGASQDKGQQEAARNRLGGKVRRAWPAPGAKGRPKTPLTRWLARQVGPQKVVPCKKRPRSGAQALRGQTRAASTAGRAPRRWPRAAASSAHRAGRGRQGDRRTPALSSSARSTFPSTIRPTHVCSTGRGPTTPRSPRRRSPLWASARSPPACSTSSPRSNARAERSSSRSTSGRARAASRSARAPWRSPGSAFTNYDQVFQDKRYLDNARLAAKYLLSLRNAEGLVRGGPDVKWVSTQHNLLTVIFLTILSDTLQQHGDQEAADAYRAAAEEIAKGIETHLVVRDGGLLHFRQGFNDETLPLDAQALGVIYSFMRGNEDLGKQVYAYAQSNFQVFGPLGRALEGSRHLQHDLRGQGSVHRLPPLPGQEGARCALVRGNGRDALHHVGDR